jgi:hypothetical protein
MDVVSKKVSIDLNIRTAFFKVENPTEVYIEWQRGTNSIESKVRELDTTLPSVLFNDKFQMKTSLEYDQTNGIYLPKKSVLALLRKKDKKLLGNTDFDLSVYANKGKPTGEKLILSNCEQDDAYIEIFIKATAADQSTPRTKGTTDRGSEYSKKFNFDDNQSSSDRKTETKTESGEDKLIKELYMKVAES